MYRFLPLVILLAILVSGTAAARDVVVSNRRGDDRNRGFSLQPQVAGDGAVRTLRKALALARPGDRIILENTGEPYREAISVIGGRHSGGWNGPLIIEGRGAVLDGSTPIPDDAWQPLSGDVFACRPARLGRQRLFLDGRPAVEHPAVQGSSIPPKLQPLEWCQWNGQILFCVEPGKLPQDYRPSCCGLQTGITLYYVQDVLIRDLVVQGFAIDGVAVHDVVHDTRLERIVSRDNGLSGFSVRGASWVELDECSAIGNGQSQLRVSDFARCWTYRCLFAPSSAPAVQLQGGELHESREPFARVLR
jgi:hypothetical protein